MSSLNAKTYESAPSQNVAFLGLGVMGYPMAGHLARAGHAVTVYNRSAAKAAAWCQEFADSKQPAHAATPREAVKNGDAAIFEITKPAAMAFSRAYTLMGESGAGQLTKMVNQVCIAGLVQGLSEAIAFGQKAGLDMNLVLDVIGKGAAQSWQMDNRGKTMVADKFDFGFAVDWMRKDLGLVMDEAKRNGARLPVTALVDQFYADVQQMGGKRWDTSSLIKRVG